MAGLGQPGGGGQFRPVVHEQEAAGGIRRGGDGGLGQDPPGADVALGPPAGGDLFGVGQAIGVGGLPGHDHPQGRLVRQRQKGDGRQPLARRAGQADLVAVHGQHGTVHVDRRRAVDHEADGDRDRRLVGDLDDEGGRPARAGGGEGVVHDVAADNPDPGLDHGGVADEGLAHGGLDGRHVPAVLGPDPPAQRPVGPGSPQPARGVDRAEPTGAEDPEIGHLSPVRRRPSA